jgi:site-specific recombinase XerD
VLRHWRLTGPDSITKTTVVAAVDKYIEFRKTLGLARKTVSDSRSALRMFRLTHGAKYIQEITAAEARAYIDQRQASGKKACFKQLKLLFDYCKSERLIAVNPMDSIKSPTSKPSEVQVYKPEDFEKLLRYADAHYPDLVPFLALSGLACTARVS